MARQQLLFAPSQLPPRTRDATSSTFADNLRLPVHRWFRFSAGFSAGWAESLISEALLTSDSVNVFDPFAGSGTTLLAAENQAVSSMGTEAHPFLYRVAKAKLFRRTNVDTYSSLSNDIVRSALRRKPNDLDSYPKLIHKCYDPETLAQLDVLRVAVENAQDGSPEAELVWLTLVSIIRKTSHANTAQWQYVLPRKRKQNPDKPFDAFETATTMFCDDMLESQHLKEKPARLLLGDARDCEGVPDGFANLVITSPPYPNNYDYADATRLEMSFFKEISRWGDLQDHVRKYLIRSCSQHVPERAVDLDEVIGSDEVVSIRDDLHEVCAELGKVRLTKGGKKTYHLMVACYFHDLARVWRSLRRVCRSPSRVCFVVGDSAPYGVYVPVIDWLGRLAVDAGFKSFSFEQTRERNVKWKNRKHRVPLCEGRLWVEG